MSQIDGFEESVANRFFLYSFDWYFWDFHLQQVLGAKFFNSSSFATPGYMEQKSKLFFRSCKTRANSAAAWLFVSQVLAGLLDFFSLSWSLLAWLQMTMVASLK